VLLHLVLCVAALLLLSVGAVSRTERGALKLLFWATDGRNWAIAWDVQNEQSDPCLDAVGGSSWFAAWPPLASHDDCCFFNSQWYGIVCDRHERIQAMYARPPSLHAGRT